MLTNKIFINEKIRNLILFTIMFICSFTLIRLYFKPFFIIGFLYIIMKPICNIFIKKNDKHKKMYVAILIILMNIGFFLLIFYMGSSIYILINKLISIDFIPECEYIKKLLAMVTNNSQDFIKSILGNYSTYIKYGAMSTGEGLISYIIANISVYFLIIDENKFRDLVKKVLGNRMYSNMIKNYNIFKKYFGIEFILMLLSTLLTMIGFVILGVNNGVSLAVLCGFLDILPYVGTIIVFIPLIIYNIIIKDYFVSISLLLLYVIVQIVREVLEAKYISYSFSLHPLAVLISMYVGVKFLGFLGVIAGPIFCLFAKDIMIN